MCNSTGMLLLANCYYSTCTCMYLYQIIVIYLAIELHAR